MRSTFNLRLALASALVAATATLATALPATAETPTEIESRFFGTHRYGDDRERPLAVGLLEFSDQRMAQPASYYDGLFFGTGGKWPNIRNLFTNSSYGRFTWSRAGVYGPFEHPNDFRTTSTDESKRQCVIDDPLACPGVSLVSFSLPDNNPEDDDTRPFYLGASGGGGAGSIVDAKARDLGSYERFKLLDVNRERLMSGDTINLETYNSQFLSAAGGGGGQITGDRQFAREWERFVLVKRGGSAGSEIVHGDRVTLQSYNRRYVSAINGGGGEVRADRTNPGSWETFTFKEEPYDEDRLTRFVVRRAAEQGLNYAAYAGGDNHVANHELGFVRLVAGSNGGAQCCPSPTLSVPGTQVTVRPALTRGGDTPGLTLIAHELVHALGADQHIYGTNDNSFGLTFFTTGAGGDKTFHLDPWWKFRLGWLRPRYMRLDVPMNSCGYTLAADDESQEFLQGATPSSNAPILLYHPNRPGEYYFVEYRKQAGADRDAASTGMVLWLIKTNEDERLAEVPGQIIDGGLDNLLDSVVASGSDDVRKLGGFQSRLRIYPGSDRRLDSVVANDDDRGTEPVDIAIGAPRDAQGQPVTRQRLLWGGSQAWTAADGIVEPRWVDGSLTRARIQAGVPAGLPGTAMPMEIAVNHAFVPYLESVSPRSAFQGSTVTLTGQTLGVRGTKRVLARNAASGKVYSLPILSWPGCNSATARIPSTLPAGSYRVYIEGDGQPRPNSGARDLVVIPAAAGG